jgi:tripartite-type tricarboxylate transporter receptor subunit TctC
MKSGTAWVRALTFFCSLLACAIADAATVDRFPEKPVRIVLPAAPGGAYDVLLRGRGINNLLVQRWGQQVVVDNRPGGGGVIGTAIVASAVPDGYTLLLVTTGFATNPFLQKQLPYSTPGDFTPVTILGAAPNVLVAHPSIPAAGFREFLALARDRSARLNYASSGSGSGGHLSMELLKRMAGIDALHVPYKSAGPALTDVIAGHVQLLITATASAIPHIKTGRLKPLAVTSPMRTSVLPDIPTIAESGVAGYAVEGWYGVFGPRGMPAALTARLHRDLASAVSDPDVAAHFRAYGFEPKGTSPAEFSAYIAAEMKKWGQVIREAGITAD